MGDVSRWIDWFRDATSKLPGVAPAGPQRAPVVDAERVRRVVRPGSAASPVSDLRALNALSPAERMIGWLKTQSPQVVDVAAEVLNWDRAQDVILWLLAQPTTQAATAVKLFMRAEPAYYVSQKAKDPAYRADEAVEAVIQTFAAHWTADRYARGGVGYDPSVVTPYGSSDVFYINELNQMMAELEARGVHPLPPLPGLAGPFDGPQPKPLDDYLAAMTQNELFLLRYLFAGLGTWLADENIREADFDAWRLRSGLADA